MSQTLCFLLYYSCGDTIGLLRKHKNTFLCMRKSINFDCVGIVCVCANCQFARRTAPDVIVCAHTQTHIGTPLCHHISYHLLKYSSICVINPSHPSAILIIFLSGLPPNFPVLHVGGRPAPPSEHLHGSNCRLRRGAGTRYPSPSQRFLRATNFPSHRATAP